MKPLLILLLTLFAGVLFANPEVASVGPNHFIIDRTNADHEVKIDSGQCKGAPITNGDGTAWAEVTCVWQTSGDRLPWYNSPGLEDTLSFRIDSVNDFPDAPCQIYGANNNAGNNQGYNVTQYDSNSWAQLYSATEINDPNGNLLRYVIKAQSNCYDGQPQ
jgi:hypothetical protein